MIRILFVCVCYFLVSCNSDPESDDNNQLIEISKDSTATYTAVKMDSILMSNPGMIKTLRTDENTCNLKKGYYLITVETDSAELAYTATKKAKELFKAIRPGEDCPNEVMTESYLYLNKYDFYNNDPVASCSISSTKSVNVMVDMAVLNQRETK